MRVTNIIEHVTWWGEEEPQAMLFWVRSILWQTESRLVSLM